MVFRTNRLLAATVVMSAVLGASVSAMAVDVDAVVKERQTAMRQQYKDLLTIKDFLDGKRDQAAAIAAADALTQDGSQGPRLVPAGDGDGRAQGEVPAKARDVDPGGQVSRRTTKPSPS